MSTSVAVNVYLFHPDVEEAKVINCFITSKTEYDGVADKPLTDLRTLLLQNRRIKSSVQFLPFCTSQGAEVEDSVQVSDYNLVVDDVEEKEAPTGGLPQYKAYFRKSSGPGDKLITESGNSISQRSLKALAGTKSEYDSGDWGAAARNIEFDHPADMTEQQWNAVLRNTGLLSANVISFQYAKTAAGGGVEAKVPQLIRAPYPAFKVKPRELLSSEKEDIPVHVENVRIPIFTVTDESYVEAYETSTFMAESMAKSSFSKTDVEASAGGGGFGFSAEVTAGLSTLERESWSQSHEESESMMHITYNFPRVTLHMSPSCLEMDEQCVEDLRKISNEANYLSFHRKYGQFYPQRVLLGGRLYSSQKSSSFGEMKSEAKEETLKISASMSFKAPFVQGSASASNETGSSESSSSQIKMSSGTLNWHANGGDTLLCNNPPLWCATVASHYYWRIQQQTDPLPMLDFIDMFPEMAPLVERARNHAPE